MPELYNSSFSISEVENMKLISCPLIIYFSLFSNNLILRFKYSKFSKICSIVFSLETGFLVGLHLTLNSDILQYSIHSLVGLSSKGLKEGQYSYSFKHIKLKSK